MTAAVLVCLAAVLLASGIGPVRVTGDGPLDRWRATGDGSAEQAPEPTDDTVVDTGEVDEPALGVPVEVLLAMVFTVVAAALLARAVLRAPRPVDDEDEPEGQDARDDLLVDLDAVAGAARRGLVRLEEVAGAGATDVVVACWVELEVAAGRTGVGRAATDTPTDFAARLHAAAPALDPGVLTDLRNTYSRARYGSAGASADDVRRAREALRQLLHTLGRATAATTAARSTTGTGSGPSS